MKPISPLEIVQRTPKTNCGECGHPTCLAFGAAVAKTGGDPTACPYINLKGLSIETAKPSKDQREKDLEFVAYLKSKIAPLDFNFVAETFGAKSNKDLETLNFDYLGQSVQLSKETILLNGVEPEDPRDQILLYNYISAPADFPLSGEWVGMESLPTTISKIRTLAEYGEDRIAKLFSTIPFDTINSIINNLNPSQPLENTASYAAIIPVLPKVPQYLLFWEEDKEDNFDAKVKILFDKNVLSFLDLESLVFSSERLADKIIELSKSSS